VQWGDAHVFKVGGKMFALSRYDDPSTPPRFSFKASDMAFELLIEQGVASPSPYMARAKWVVLASAGALPDEEVKAYLAQAHALVAAKLPKKTRVALGLGRGSVCFDTDAGVS
jgi:predicted DNA-binding protein (MmcQ/YjbR family)